MKQAWIRRHIITLALASVIFAGVYYLRLEWSPMHRWNRAFGDASFALVALAMVLGPLSRLSTGRLFRKLLPYRRELGIYAIVAASVHTIIILLGWVQLDFMRLFGFEFHPQLQEYVMFQQGFGFANIIGIAALAYGLMLAITSNDLSQRLLGASVWKYIQQSTYILWALTVAHTAYFLFMHFLDFHRATPDPNILQWPFVIIVLGVVVLQTAASVKTWKRQRGRSDTGDNAMSAEA